MSEEKTPIIKAVRDFIKECPYLDAFHKGIGVDYLAEDDTAYMIESVPADPVIKSYTDGSSVRQFVFVFASREAYGSDVLQNIENSGFFEDFAEWLEKQTLEGNLLDLGPKRTARSIRASTLPYVFDNEVHKAQYQIQCQLKYFQEKF